jgi:hypothetical protein
VGEWLREMSNYFVACKQRSMQSTEAKVSLEMITGSVGGGSALTLIAVDRMAKAAINPQPRNLIMIVRSENREFS